MKLHSFGSRYEETTWLRIGEKTSMPTDRIACCFRSFATLQAAACSSNGAIEFEYGSSWIRSFVENDTVSRISTGRSQSRAHARLSSCPVAVTDDTLFAEIRNASETRRTKKAGESWNIVIFIGHGKSPPLIRYSFSWRPREPAICRINISVEAVAIGKF